MLADSYYCSYFLIADQQLRGVDVVFEQHGARRTDCRCGEKLGARDHVVRWSKPVRPGWMSQEDYARYPDELRMRDVKVRKKVLVTTFFGARESIEKCLGKVVFTALARRAGLEKYQDHFGHGDAKLQDGDYVRERNVGLFFGLQSDSIVDG